MLKRTLFDTLQSLSCGQNISGEIPLSGPLSPAALAYQSPIALALAGSEPQRAPVFAHQLVAIGLGQKAVLPDTNLAAAIAPHWHITTDARGRLTLALQALGITEWLHYLDAYQIDERSRLKTIPPGQLSFLYGALSQLPLCMKLRLSFPMLLQFGYARCCTWLQHLQKNCRSLSVPTLAASAWQQVPASRWMWVSEIPEPYHHLLITIARSLDALVDAATPPDTSLRQGYALAQAIYHFQAAVCLQCVVTAPEAHQGACWGLTRAAQQVLALILSNILGLCPLPDL